MNDLPLIDLDMYPNGFYAGVWSKRSVGAKYYYDISKASAVRLQQMQLKLYDQMKGTSPNEQDRETI